MAFGIINIYPTPQSLQNKVDEYFDYCFVMENKFGRLVPKVVVPPTFSGLARYLGFSTRRALLDYAANNGNEQFCDVLDDAKLRIEDFYEGRLVMSKGPSTGIQFALKNNCNWEEANKTQLTGADGNSPVVFTWGIEEKAISAEDAEVVEAVPAPLKQIVSAEEKAEATEKDSTKKRMSPKHSLGILKLNSNKEKSQRRDNRYEDIERGRSH